MANININPFKWVFLEIGNSPYPVPILPVDIESV